MSISLARIFVRDLYNVHNVFHLTSTPWAFLIWSDDDLLRAFRTRWKGGFKIRCAGLLEISKALLSNETRLAQANKGGNVDFLNIMGYWNV